MTHGDAIMIMADKRSTDYAKIKALEYIVENEHPSDINYISKPIMWNMLKLVFRRYKSKS